MLATSEGGLTSSWLAVHLLELKALVAVAIALGVAKVIAGRGPATLFGGLFGRGLAPVGTRAHMQAEVLALHAELLTAAGQDVLAGGPGTLGPGGTLCGSRHVSVLARSQLLFSSFGFTKSLILSCNETLLTVSFKHGASEGAALPPQAGDCVLEPGGCGTGFPRGSDKMFIFSVLDETQRAKALVFWSPKIHAASFSALACPRPVPWSPRGLGQAARWGLTPSSVARMWGGTLGELRGVRLGPLVTGRRDTGAEVRGGLCRSPFEASTADPIKCPGDVLEAGLALTRIKVPRVV